MDSTNKILNLVVPPLAFLLLFLISPLRIAVKFLQSVTRCFHVENVAGKVVIITGASSGIGEHLAYEYARRGARLALVARREDCLRVIAEGSRQLGSPDVIVLRADVSDVGDCKRFVDETVNYFGQVDHLVNNAGIVQPRTFEEYTEISDAVPVMNINFWGPVYATHFAVPHLKKTKGKIVVTSSISGWLPSVIMSFYAASKAAINSFYETLSIELGSEIGVTIVTPGVIQTEMLSAKLFEQVPELEHAPRGSAEACAKAIVNGVCRGKRYVAEPSWVGTFFWQKVMWPEVLYWLGRRSLKLRKNMQKSVGEKV